MDSNWDQKQMHGEENVEVSCMYYQLTRHFTSWGKDLIELKREAQ